MSIVKVIEVLAQSDKSWEDAAQQAINEASKSIRNIKSLYVDNFQVVLKSDGAAPKLEYRLDAKISFEVERAGGERSRHRPEIARATH